MFVTANRFSHSQTFVGMATPVILQNVELEEKTNTLAYLGFCCIESLWASSLHFIFCVTHEWAQLARVFCPWQAVSSLFYCNIIFWGPFMSYGKNEVL